jgi:hypothetical protein
MLLSLGNVFLPIMFRLEAIALNWKYTVSSYKTVNTDLYIRHARNDDYGLLAVLPMETVGSQACQCKLCLLTSGGVANGSSRFTGMSVQAVLTSDGVASGSSRFTGMSVQAMVADF